jgi:hypothetical protein
MKLQPLADRLIGEALEEEDRFAVGRRTFAVAHAQTREECYSVHAIYQHMGSCSTSTRTPPDDVGPARPPPDGRLDRSH